MRVRRGGFTLIELLVVLVVLGILAAIAVPKYYNAKREAYLTTMKNDLKVLAIQQELYHKQFITYASAPSALTDYVISPGVTVNLNSVTPRGWAATATHVGATGDQCGVFFGVTTAANAPPATQPGVIACTP